jgi:type VI secretion system ImpH/TssG family protein
MMNNSDIKSYDYFKLITVLLKKHNINEVFTRIDNKKLSLKPCSSITFPATDIQSLDESDTKLQITLNFMGLYGVDTCLPLYFTSLLNSKIGNGLEGLIDLFNHRFYVLLYLSWKSFNFHTGMASNDHEYLCFLSTLSAGRLQPKDGSMLAYANLMRLQSVEGLKEVLQHKLFDVKVDIVQNIPCEVELSNCYELSSSRDTIVGDNIILGNKILDCTQLISINLHINCHKQADEFIGNKYIIQQLNHFIRCYCGELYQYNFYLCVDSMPKKNFKLGLDSIKLGLCDKYRLNLKKNRT